MDLPEETEFSLLMARVQSGDQQAATEVVQRYGEAILRVVRRRLDQRLRPEYDSIDFLQETWSSFFHTAQYYTFQTPDDLVAFLANLACHKITDAERHRIHTRGSLSGEKPLPQPAEGDRENELIAHRQPTPSQVAVANEQWENLLRGLPPEYQQMLELLRQGYSHEEIAQNLGIYTKVIQRLLEKLERKRHFRRKGNSP